MPRHNWTKDSVIIAELDHSSNGLLYSVQHEMFGYLLYMVYAALQRFRPNVCKHFMYELVPASHRIISFYQVRSIESVVSFRYIVKCPYAAGKIRVGLNQRATANLPTKIRCLFLLANGESLKGHVMRLPTAWMYSMIRIDEAGQVRCS